MTQRDPMPQLTQLTQVKFNDPMTQHDPMTQCDTCAIRFSPLSNNGPRARRRVYFPFGLRCLRVSERFGSIRQRV